MDGQWVGLLLKMIVEWDEGGGEWCVGGKVGLCECWHCWLLFTCLRVDVNKQRQPVLDRGLGMAL